MQWFGKKSRTIIILLGILVYSNSLFNGFVWDDETQILNNGLVHSIANLPTFFAGSTFGTGGAGGLGGIYYKPLMSTTFSLIYSIFGQQAFFFHLVQLGLHIANAYLVFLLFNKLLRREISLFLSVIFLVHPFNTESVVYVSAMQDVLFTFFGLLSFYFLLKGIKLLKEYILVFGLLLFSMLSKETGVVFLFSSLFFSFIYKRSQFIKSLLAATSVMSIYLLLRLGVANVPFTTQHLSPITRVDLLTRLMTLPKIVYFYVSNFVFPYDLAIDQQWIVHKISLRQFYIPLAVMLVFGILTFGFLLHLIKVNDKVGVKVYLFFLSILIFGLGAHLQIFPLDMTVADRWFYLPMIGVLGMVGVLISCVPKFIGISLGSLPKPLPRWNVVLVILVAFLITALSARSVARNFQWKDGLTLFSNDIKISKNAFDLENNLGVELFRVGRYEEAEEHFRKSTVLAPYWWSNWNGLGAIYERQSEFDRAIESYKKAVDNGVDSLAFENLANLLFLKKGSYESQEFVSNAVLKLPYNPRLWLLLALSEYDLGNKEAALIAAKNAYNLSPSDQTYYVYSTILQGKKLDIK